MSEITLKPCPFCGGEASKRLFYKGKYRVHCNVCDAHSGDVCNTEAEAIAAWNTRAELGSGTCYSTTNDSAWCFVCSECGKSFPRNNLHLAHNHGEINYCPHCGRKVVSA